LQLKGKGTASIITKQHGVIAGIEEIVYLVKKFTNLPYKQNIHDENLVSSGETVLSIYGDNSELLAYDE